MPVLNTANAVYFGSSQVDNVYLGNVLVYSRNPAPPVLMPYHQDWPAWSAADALSGISLQRVADNTALGGGLNAPASAGEADNGDSISYQFDVDAGTYALTVIYAKFSDYAIINFKIDGTSIGTVDAYNSTVIANNVTTFSGIVLGAGNHTLMAQANGKNASSADYRIVMNWLSIDRTSA